MALEYDIDIQVAGPEHRGKTTLIAYLAKLLEDAGADLIVQRADDQIDEKLRCHPTSFATRSPARRFSFERSNTSPEPSVRDCPERAARRSDFFWLSYRSRA